jgi:hypothetical protein
MKYKILKEVKKQITRTLKKNKYTHQFLQFIQTIEVESYLPEWVLSFYPNYFNRYNSMSSIEGTLQCLEVDMGDEQTKVNNWYTLADVMYERMMYVGSWFVTYEAPDKLQRDYDYILQAFVILAFNHFSPCQQLVALDLHVEHNQLGIAIHKSFYLNKYKRETLVYILKRVGIIKTLDEIPKSFKLAVLKKYIPKRIIDQKDEEIDKILHLKNSMPNKIEFLFQQFQSLDDTQKVHLLVLLGDTDYQALKERIMKNQEYILNQLNTIKGLPKLVEIQARSALKYGYPWFLCAADKRRSEIEWKGTYSALDDDLSLLLAHQEYELKKLKEIKTTFVSN